MYYGSDASSSSFEPVYASDKGYTHAFCFIAATAALEFLSSLFYRNKFVYCRKGSLMKLEDNVEYGEDIKLSETPVKEYLGENELEL